jgi:Ca2+/Na+ antiporter
MPNYPTTICFFTLVLSLIWIWFTANILISLLMAMANLMNIPDSFLGMTILTYGNSVPDLMLNLSLVKLGYGEMALSGSIAGPLFNLLMGLGLPLLKLNLKKGGIDIVFFDKSNIIGVLCLGFLFVNLIALGLQARCAKYHLNIKLAVVRFIFYVLFFVLICFMIFLVK